MLVIDVAKEAFSSPGAPLLRAETFRTAETPFSGWSISQVVALVVLALGLMSLGGMMAALRHRLASVASAASLIALLLLVVLTPIGRYGLGSPRQVGILSASQRFVSLESGARYDLAGKFPYGAVEIFQDRFAQDPSAQGLFPEEEPQDLVPGSDKRVDLRDSRVAAPVPLFEVSGTNDGAYLRQLIFERYVDGVWSQDPRTDYNVHTPYASGLYIQTPSRKSGAEGMDVSVIPITQMAPGEIVTSSNTRVIRFPDPLYYSPGRGTGFAPNSYALAYSFATSSDVPGAELPSLAPAPFDARSSGGSAIPLLVVRWQTTWRETSNPPSRGCWPFSST